MRFLVTLKDPDTLISAIHDAVDEEVGRMSGLSLDEKEVVAEKRAEATNKMCAKWFKWSEYLTVEIDTEAGTATVCQVETDR